MKIYCAGCNGDVDARLTDGAEIYPHRKDLSRLPFWICDTCKNYVGCHHKSSNPTKPKGIIPTSEVRAWRVQLHKLIDPLWKTSSRRKQARSRIYAMMSEELGYTYHSGDVRDKEMFDKSMAAALKVSKTLINERKT